MADATRVKQKICTVEKKMSSIKREYKDERKLSSEKEKKFNPFVSKKVDPDFRDNAGSELVSELVRLFINVQGASQCNIQFLQQSMMNPLSNKNGRRWDAEVIAFLGNAMCCMGSNAYKFLAKNLTVPSLSFLHRDFFPENSSFGL